MSDPIRPSKNDRDHAGDPPSNNPASGTRDKLSVSPLDKLILCVAQGFNVGRLPFAPGTFGSLLGLLWFAVLVIPGSLWIYAAGTIAGICFSVWCCGQAERILRIADPGSVVLDEIVALPVCFLPWVLNTSKTADAFPSVETLFNREHWYIVPLVFVLFRFFDVVKPFPIGRSQRLPGGWGVTMDDVLAGLATALVSLLFVAR